MFQIWNDLPMTGGCRDHSILMLPDLSTASDTAHHASLISRDITVDTVSQSTASLNLLLVTGHREVPQDHTLCKAVSISGRHIQWGRVQCVQRISHNNQSAITLHWSSYSKLKSHCFGVPHFAPHHCCLYYFTEYTNFAKNIILLIKITEKPRRRCAPAT